MAVTTIEDERLEQLRQIYDAFSRGDADGVTATSHPDIVVVRAASQGELRGVEAIRAWVEPDAFSSQVVEPVGFWVDGDKVLVYLRGVARGAGSGIELEIGSWTVWTFDDDGLVTRVQVFLDHEEHLARNALLASWSSS